jgi:membrane associated rhomboid family serine protease
VNGENEQSLISSIRSPESSAKTSDNYLTDPRKLSAYILIVANLVGLLVTLAYAAYMHGPDYPIADSFELEGLRRLGANYGPYTLDGQYWRVITSLFLHSGFWHFLINMLFLWRLGVLHCRLAKNGRNLSYDRRFCLNSDYLLASHFD